MLSFKREISHAKYVQFLKNEKKPIIELKNPNVRSNFRIYKKKKKKFKAVLKLDMKKYSLEAEEKLDLILLSKFNSSRKAVKEKRGILETF